MKRAAGSGRRASGKQAPWRAVTRRSFVAMLAAAAAAIAVRAKPAPKPTIWIGHA